MPKDVRRLVIRSQMWEFYVGGNFLIDHVNRCVVPGNFEIIKR
jgi:hypothetical protein